MSVTRDIVCVKQSRSEVREDGQNKASLIESGRFFEENNLFYVMNMI